MSSSGFVQSSLRPVLLQVMEVAARYPDAVAVEESDGRALRYGELVSRARGVAAWLVARGAGPEATVGVCLPRGGGLAIAELGVWLAGAAFVPLDPESPAERLAAIAGDARLRWVLGDAAALERLAGPGGLGAVEWGRVDRLAESAAAAGALPAPAAGPRQLAYVMYTSGSTGRPKGVMVEHGALASFVDWHRGAFELAPDARATFVYSPAFDSSMAELWPALTAGAALVVPDAETRLVPERLQAWLGAARITHADLPSPLVDALLELPWPADGALRALLSGGDRLHGRPPAHVPWRLYNQYGPTEATVTATSGRVAPSGEGLPGIGRPIAGVAAYVLDEALQPVADGVEGELYLGGACVARGYLGQPEATAARFVTDPFSAEPDARMYRTGDRVRRSPSGELAFCGRADDQIKLRGFRIEPAEIAAALRAHPGLADAHVMLRGDALAAYVVPADPRGEAPGEPELRAHLARRLPAYMLPAAYVALPALPLTPNGKVDAAALPAPVRAPVAPRARPGSELERELAALWQRVLRVDEVGVDDSFFDLGGNSLLLAQVHHALATGARAGLPMLALFEHPTIRALARYLASPPPPAAPAAPDPAAAESQAAARARLQGRRGRVGRDREGA